MLAWSMATTWAPSGSCACRRDRPGRRPAAPGTWPGRTAMPARCPAQRRSAQEQHQPRLADRLHPRPDQADDLSVPEEAEVPVPQRGDAAPERGGGRADGGRSAGSASSAPTTLRRGGRRHRAGGYHRGRTLLAMLTKCRADATPRPPAAPDCRLGYHRPRPMTIRPIRLAAGWALALVAALLLNLVLTRTTTAPEGASSARSLPQPPRREPAKAASRASGDPIDRLPPVVGIPPGATPDPARRARRSSSRSRHVRKRPAGGHPSRARGLRPRRPGHRRVGGRHRGWTGASGWARDGLTRLDGSSPFAIASITKTFTAALTLQLIDEAGCG